MISDVYFPRVNGVSTSISVFRRALAALDHEITLLAPDYPNTAPERGVERVPSRYLFFDPEDRLIRPRALRQAYERLSDKHFDLVHIQTPFVAHYVGLRLARQLGIPVIETYHTFFEEYLYCYVKWLPRGWLRSTARTLTRRQCNALDGVVVPSAAMFDTLSRYGVQCEMKVLPTGIELDNFARGDGEAFRRQHGIDPVRPTLLYVGRVAFEKNIGFLIDVLERVRQKHPGVLLLIAGEGPAETHLRRLVDARGLGDNIRFVGYLSRDGALQDCYLAGDIFVFASRTETQGLVLLEAMAMGRPVVSTAEMGTREILRPEAGALVAEEDTDAFAAKVVQLLDDPALRERLGSIARTYAASWSADRLAREMAGHYAHVVATHGSGAPGQRPLSRFHH